MPVNLNFNIQPIPTYTNIQIFSCDLLTRIWEAVRDIFKSCFGICSQKEPLEVRDHRLISSDTEVHRRLQAQMRYAQRQMEREPVKNFQYMAAQEGFHAHEELVGNLPVGVCHAQGRRPTMEDEHLATEFHLQIAGRDYPVQLFGIFDGHGGPAASQFVRDHLKDHLETALREFNPNGLSEAGIWRALKMTFVRLNNDFKNAPDSISNRQGTTATVAMILDNKLWTANVGDSRTVLNNAGTPVQLTEDAKPSDPRYKRNIENRGGQVVWVLGVPRVNGRLAVARAIGDHRMMGAINARPKITVKDLSEIKPGSDLFLCCDGIWDVFRTKDVVAAAHDHRGSSVGTLAKDIVYSAYNAGSGDNLSALVVKIK